MSVCKLSFALWTSIQRDFSAFPVKAENGRISEKSNYMNVRIRSGFKWNLPFGCGRHWLWWWKLVLTAAVYRILSIFCHAQQSQHHQDQGSIESSWSTPRSTVLYCPVHGSLVLVVDSGDSRQGPGRLLLSTAWLGVCVMRHYSLLRRWHCVHHLRYLLTFLLTYLLTYYLVNATVLSCPVTSCPPEFL